MKKIKYILALPLLLASCAQAQDNQQYKDCVKEFYKLFFSEKKVTIKDFSKVYSNSLEASFLINNNLQKQITYLQAQKEVEAYSDTMESQTLLRMKTYRDQLTFGLDYNSICKQIDLSSIYNEGTEFSMLLELKFSETNVVYFEINSDTPKEVIYIWVSTGESLGDLIQGSKNIGKFKRPGIINDTDGYANIREDSDKDSQITGKLINEELFYYTPTNTNDWWAVYKEEGGKQVGYIHRSRVLKYSEFPKKLKEKVRSQRGGC